MGLVKDISDPIGSKTLEIIGEAKEFNKWMFDTIYPFSKGKILEIGSGIGNLSELFLNRGDEIYLSDLRQEYCTHLRYKFDHRPNLLGISQIDLAHPDFDNVYPKLIGHFDTVFALNVIEHIEDDTLALDNCRKLLNEKGHLIILVPSYSKLYNRFDKELGHFRRYNKRKLTDLFFKSDFSILHQQYFNFAGIPGWYISGKVFNNKSIPAHQMNLYNALVPAFRIIDKLLVNKAGLSTIVVGRK